MTFSNSNAPNEKVFEYLSSEGYRPKYDEDGDIIVKREGKTFAIIFEENDPIYFRVLYPNFWSLDDETEYEQAMIAAARVNRTLKCVKVLPSVEFNEDSNVSASVELYAPDVDAFIAVLDRAFMASAAAGMQFGKEMRAIRLNDDEE